MVGLVWVTVFVVVILIVAGFLNRERDLYAVEEER